MNWEAAISSWVEHMTAGALSPKTITLRRYQLRRLAADHPGTTPWDLDTRALTAWLSRHAWAPATRRSFRAALSRFFAHIWHDHDHPAAGLPNVRLPRYRPRPAPTARIIAALDRADNRTALAIRIAAESGPRRGELVRLHRDDLVNTGNGWWARVQGKGGHIRFVPLTDETAALALLAPGWLFAARDGRPLSPHHLGKTITAALGGDFTTHSLRHHAGTAAYQRTRDLRAVQELLGHARPETTAVYTDVSADAVRACIGAVQA